MAQHHGPVGLIWFSIARQRLVNGDDVGGRDIQDSFVADRWFDVAPNNDAVPDSGRRPAPLGDVLSIEALKQFADPRGLARFALFALGVMALSDISGVLLRQLARPLGL
jgi:hypothetical protein